MRQRVGEHEDRTHAVVFVVACRLLRRVDGRALRQGGRVIQKTENGIKLLDKCADNMLKS